MVIGDVVLALVLGVLFAALIGAVFGVRGGTAGFLMLFLLFFLFAWAGGLWIGPLGPAFLGVYWLPGFVVALLIFLLIGALSYHRPVSTREAQAEIEARQTAEKVFGALIWLVILGLILAIVVAYLT
ncbi:MAG TPA: hypothetical protein VKA06_11860 [Spirochaetia bacterium]|nr:hypothetical protein [Spirochaetia bacterium]